MAKTSYFESHPEIVKIFDDLEKFHDFCRFEMIKFDEADLYNKKSAEWSRFVESTNPRKNYKKRTSFKG